MGENIMIETQNIAFVKAINLNFVIKRIDTMYFIYWFPSLHKEHNSSCLLYATMPTVWMTLRTSASVMVTWTSDLRVGVVWWLAPGRGDCWKIRWKKCMLTASSQVHTVGLGLVVSVSTSHMVSCGFVSQPGHTKDHL